MNYNGQYETVIDIKITCKTHEECLKITQIVRMQCKAWATRGVVTSETKSALKGDVLSRGIMISQTDYAHEVIIFREALQCLLSFFIFKNQVHLNVRNTTPVNIPLVVPKF
jgi:hypothetical protein